MLSFNLLSAFGESTSDIQGTSISFSLSYNFWLLVQGYTGEKEKLGKCEQVCWTLLLLLYRWFICYLLSFISKIFVNQNTLLDIIFRHQQKRDIFEHANLAFSWITIAYCLHMDLYVNNLESHVAVFHIVGWYCSYGSCPS